LNKAKAIVKKPKIKPSRSDSDDDVPLAAKSKPKPVVSKKFSPTVAKKKPAKQESDSDDDVPLARKKVTKRPKPETDSDDDVPLAAKTKKPKTAINGVKKEVSSPATKRKSKAKKEEADANEELKPEEDDEEYKWWEANQGDGSVKWTTLEHNGVLFPPPYEPLPKHVKMKYDGKEVSLPPEAEEVAGFFAALIESDHGQNSVFQKNFFEDWLEILQRTNGPSQIKEFKKCDFRPMWEYFETKKEEKKAMTKDEKLRAKQEKDTLEAPFKTCLLDGRKENVGNFRIEPPGLFRGRGKHPKTGKLKVSHSKM
jgi:DNA topoisomerase I